MKKLGVFGGTFNPIHSGHIKAANEALKIMRLDEVIFIPNKIPPHKQMEYKTDEHDRFMMTHLATKNNPNFIVSDIELRREGVSYTYDTIAALKEIYPNDKLFFMAGLESLINYKWYKLDELLALLEGFLVIKRPGTSVEQFNEMMKNSELENADKIRLLEIDTIEISSTQVREKIDKNESLREYLPEEVINYIKKNGLYPAPTEA